MFSSAGYFKGLNCPFFLSGLCERPYCHFKHSKPDEGKTQPNKTSSSSYADKPWSGTTNSTESSIETLNGKTLEIIDKPETRKVIGYNKYTGDPIYEEFKQEKYEVENPNERILVGVNKYTGKPEYTTDRNRSSNAATVPEYNPTPIEELKKKNANGSPNCKNGNSSEYDPEENFSTKSITASHSFPLHVAAKRLVSYEPTKIRPAKIPRKSSYEFDISRFSDSDECQQVDGDPDEEYSPMPIQSIEEKSSNFSSEEVSSFQEDSNGSKKEDAKQTVKKDVNSLKYFENLLLSDPKKSSFEDIVKSKITPSEEPNDGSDGKSSSSKDSDGPQKKKRKYTKSFELSDDDDDSKPINDKQEEKQVKKDKRKNKDSHKENAESNIFEKILGKSSEKNSNSEKKSSSGKLTSDKGGSKSDKNNCMKDKTKGEKVHSESKYSSKSENEKGDNVKEKHSRRREDHKSETSGKKSSSDYSLNSKHKHSHRDKDSHRDKHSFKHKDSNHSHSHKDKQQTTKIHIESGSHKDKHSKNHSQSERHSSSRSKHSDHKSHSSSSRQSHHKNSHSSSDSKHSNNKSQSSEKLHLSSSSEKQCSKRKSSNSTDSDKSVTSNVPKEKRLSTEYKIVDINVNLFGEDSDAEPLDDSDFEHNPLIDEDDLFDQDPYDECLQIFKESQQAQKGKPTVNKPKKSSPEKKKTDELIVIPGKVRVAHKSNTTEKVAKKIVEKPYSKLSPAQVMHNRFMEMRKKALEEAAKLHSNQHSTSSSSSSSKTRVAHKPKSNEQEKPEKTVITTASKFQKRQARIPNVSNLVRPQIPAEFGSKVPTNIRQRYLNLIIDECLKLCDQEEEAFKRGQEEEMAVYNRSNTKTIYLNVAINAIKRLRNEVAESCPSTSKQTKLNAMQLSHEAVLGGKNATRATYTVKRSGQNTKIIENFKGAELYSRLSEYILTDDQLKDNGFPRPNPDCPGSAIIHKDVGYKKNDRLHEKICVRCGKKFIVYPSGKYARQEECVYHWAKAWKRKVNGLFDSRYNCCQGDSSSEGCQVGKCHVHETNKLETLSGYMKTLPTSPPIDGDYGVFAMDCEMVYTTAGVELARISVCDQDNTAVYETFVKPDNDIVDLNTRFSGITDEDLEDVTTTLRDVQAVLLSLLNDKTILMGHSLESDLTAVKMIHNTVVDTSIVFPHRLGLPYKRALRTLMAEYLQKIIQDDVGGHDSMEDAASCMDLMHMKLKDDSRKKR